MYEYKADVNDEYPTILVACKGSRVTYTAYASLPAGSTPSYIWTVMDDVSHSVSGDHVTVDCGTTDWGTLVVSVVVAPGDTCTLTARVKLIDIPVVGATTIPAYTVTSTGRKIIRVCRGEDIYFIDRSDAGNSDIAGYLWDGMSFTATTPNYTLENVSSPGKINHRVYNNCGCYDEETFEVEVVSGIPLELECYGTVCENSAVTYRYSATSPTCSDFHWYVEGGTLVGGQGTASPTVVWDRAVEGYGVIGLDGALCGGQACPTMMSLKVPVISDGLAIKGQTDVCLGEVVEYSLPLFGSTEYKWSITPSAGASLDGSPSNKTTVPFTQPGTYTLRCQYQCDFLGCGPYEAEELTITVKPRLEIEGRERVCVSNACSLQVTPGVSATWMAYDLSAAGAVVATGTGAAFSHTFGHAGRYLVTASHADYCGPATFTLTVSERPPAPAAADLDPASRHTACSGQGILLTGTPSDPNYAFVWAPACTTAAPQLYSGDSVTVSYPTEVCDVAVYYYDRQLQCQSATAYVHTVAPLTATPLAIPPNITVCPGSTITWGPQQVPDQSADGMLYEWTLEPTKQYCASVQGSHLQPHITLAVNDISTPTTFYVKLTRTFCGGSVDTIIYITVTDSSLLSLSIAGPGSVCVGEQAVFTGSGGNAATYVWRAEGSYQEHVGSFSHAFAHNGQQSVTLSAMPYTYCTNAHYLASKTKVVNVNSLPLAQVYYDSGTGTVSLVPSPDPNSYSFSWTLTPSNPALQPQSLGTTATVQYTQDGVYCCVITDVNTGCSVTVSTSVNTAPNPCGALPLTLGSFDYCEHTCRITSAQYGFDVSWSVLGGGNSVATSGTHKKIADITVDDIGVYTVSATTLSMQSPYCREGKVSFVVDFLPEFEFEPACGSIVIRNRSRYANPGQTVYLRVKDENDNVVGTPSFPVSQQSYTFTPLTTPSGSRTYTVYLNGYGTDGNISCPLGEVTIGVPPLPPTTDPVSITMTNINNQTCDNTPIELTATLNYTTAQIVSSTWNFDDGSSYTTIGNHLYHTFAIRPNYSVTVTITDNNGCVRSKQTPLTVTSHTNALANGALSYNSSMVCPIVGTINVFFTPDNPDNDYTWSTPIFNDPPPHPTHYTGNYSVYVENDNFCQKKASTFVKFKNAPTARIVADNFSRCVGNTLVLDGETGPSSGPVSYQWTVRDGATVIQSATTPAIVFTAPHSGPFSAELTVSNSLGCSSTARQTLTVNTQPTAPTLAFVGSPCITDNPVRIAATGFSGEMHWSNGATGATADYGYPGPVWAYYYDPSVGCPSDTARMRIDEQPDFDALLTGCYEKCKYFFPHDLPVYGFPNQTMDWKWWKDGIGQANSTGNYRFSPIMLPLTDFGNYRLDVFYSGSACSETSPNLSISQKEDCDCDCDSVSCDVSIKRQCPLTYRLCVTVCNNSRDSVFCFDRLTVLPGQENVFQLTYTDLVPTTLGPGHCDSFIVYVDVHGLEPAVAWFSLANNCGRCVKEFAVNLMPDVNCITDMQNIAVVMRSDFSNPVAGYFDFSIPMSSSVTLLRFWSEPPMVVNYLVTGGSLQGLGVLDVATMTQLVDENGDVCFYALVCDNGTLCKWRYCIPAHWFRDELIGMGILRNRDSSDTGDRAVQPDRQLPDTPQLMPNPATGEVNVVNVDGIVTEVLVMDMQGLQLATFYETPCLNVSALAEGVYILRVKTRDGDNGEKVNYLKLVKK